MKRLFSSNQAVGYTMIFVAGVLWGTIGLFVKLLNGVGADSGLVAFMRIFMGTIILFFYLFFTEGIHIFKIDKNSLIHCLLLGVLTQALFNYSYNMAIDAIGIATSAVLLYTAPVFVCVLSVICFKEMIGIKKVFALVINLVGCFLMITNGELDRLSISFIGIFLGVLSGFLYSLVTILGRIASTKLHPFVVVFYSFLFGSIALSVIVRPWEKIPEVSSIPFWLYAFGYGLIPTLGSYVFYFGGLAKNLELSKVPVIASVETMISVLIGIVIFKEMWGAYKLIGMIAVILSIVMINMDFRPNKNNINNECTGGEKCQKLL